jgi:cobalt-precorrin 5A hydrolase
MKIGYFSLTEKGFITAKKIKMELEGDLYTKENMPKGLFETVGRAFSSYDALVFIMAAGIVVRMIAPYIKSKTTDPAVVVCDQEGKFVISLLSGHLGGANELAGRIAAVTGGTAVITTATDVEDLISFDLFAKKNQLRIENIEELKFISQALLEGKTVDVITNAEIAGEWKGKVAVVSHYRGNPSVVIDTERKIENKQGPVLYLRPKSLYLGVGCKKQIDAEWLLACFEDFMQKEGICRENIQAVATISLKAEEKGIKKLLSALGAELIVVDMEDIRKLEEEGIIGSKEALIEKSDFVKKVTGAGSVSEACAYLASKRGVIRKKKTKYTGITFALAEEKKVYKI